VVTQWEFRPETVMSRCDTTVVTKPKLGAVATSDSGVKSVQLPVPAQPRTLTLHCNVLSRAASGKFR
jgi:hypothetical protein